jgi:hypothetical protein
MKHTKEPWAIDRDFRPGMEWNNHIVYLRDINQTICFMTHDNTPENEEGEANARRIVACVNACAGMTNEQVSHGLVSASVNSALAHQRDELLSKGAAWEQKAANWMASPEAAQRLDGYRDIAHRLNAAEIQRDELLDSIKNLLSGHTIDNLRGHDGMMDMLVTGEELKACLYAIQRVESSKK